MMNKKQMICTLAIAALAGVAHAQVSGSTAAPASGVGTLNGNAGMGRALGGAAVPGTPGNPTGISNSYGVAPALNGNNTGGALNGAASGTTGVMGNNAVVPTPEAAAAAGNAAVPGANNALPAGSPPFGVNGNIAPVNNGITSVDGRPLN